MTPEDRDEQRREIIRRLEYQDRELDAKAGKAEAEAAQARHQRADLKAAILRTQGPLPPSSECPECWFIHGRTSVLVAATHEDPADYDRLECKTCGYFEDIENG